MKLPNGNYSLEVTGGGLKEHPSKPYKIIVQKDPATLALDKPDAPQVHKAKVKVTDGTLTLRMEGTGKLNALTITRDD